VATPTAVPRRSTPTRPAPQRVGVSVLVPVLNERRHLRGAIEQMLAQRYDGGLEVLAVDGLSSDGSREILEQLAAADPRVRVFDNPARRTPQALNIGLRHARGTWVARMDAHTHYPPDYLAQGVERLGRGDVVSVSGPQIAVGDGRWSRRVALALATPLGVGSASFRRTPHAETEVASGFTGLWRRDVLDAAGGWDAGWPNDQDTELAARLRSTGGRIVCLPTMAASYVPRDSLPALLRQYRRYGLYRVKTSHRHPETLRASQLAPVVLLATVLAAARGPLAVPARFGLGAYALLLVRTAAARHEGATARDRAALPLVYAAMHVGYGAGFLTGCLRWGPPLRATVAAARRITTPPDRSPSRASTGTHTGGEGTA